MPGETITYTIPSELGPDVTITLEVIGLEEFHEEAVADERGNHVLNQITARWRTYLNPGLNSYQMAGTNLKKQSAQMPAISEQALIFFLQQPRGRLIWTIGDNIQLQTPAPKKTVDSHNGPIPRIVSIQKIAGVRTYEIVWEVVTWLNQATRITAAPPVLLSNTWTTIETLNEQYLAVRTTEGRAKFDPSRFPEGRTPDDYRDWVLPVGLRGFKRTLSITATSDGSQLMYSVQDVEQRVRLEIPGITKVQVNRMADFVCSGIGTQLLNTADAALSAGSAIAGGTAELDASVAAKKKNKKPLGGAFTGVAGATLGFAKNITSGPVVVQGVDVRVWGTRAASINTLTTQALLIANYHLREGALNGLFGSPLFTTYAFHIDQNPIDGIVAVSRVISYPPLYDGFAISSDTFANLKNSMLASNNGITSESQYVNLGTGGKINPTPVAIQQAGSSMPPQRTGSGVFSRGYINAKIFAQSIQGMGEAPVAPPLPEKPVATTNPNS